MKFCDECDYPIIINGTICQRCGKPTEIDQEKIRNQPITT